MSMLPYYPFWWSDYSGDTFSLTQGQHGAYFLLLRHIYSEGTPIPDEERFSIARALLEQEKGNVDFVLKKYFKKKNDNWQHDKAFEIIKDANKSHEKRVNAGKSGGKKKASNARGNARAKPKQPEPEPEESTYVDSLTNDKKEFKESFNEFWRQYPKQRAGRHDYAMLAYKEALTRGSKDQVHEGLKAYISSSEVKSGFAKNAADWLDKDRWRDQYSAIEKQKKQYSGSKAGSKSDPMDAIGIAMADQARRSKD